MNLVKAQAIAKDLPMQELQKYANGFNPEIIPPWLATGELQSKMEMQKRMANMMGAAQGEQPSVKEQIEQKAGLMAAQNMQQQQAQQQQAASAGPGPVPAGIPQPQDQPEEEMPQMAGGGLASVPVNFNLAGGGIVAFNGEEGSKVYRGESGEYSAEPLSAEELGRRDPLDKLKAFARWAGRNTETDPETGEVVRKPSAKEAPVSKEELMELAREARRVTPQAAPAKAAAPAMAAPQAGLRDAVQQQAKRPPAPPPQAALPGEPAAAKSPYFAQMDADLARPIVAPTTAGVLAEQRALSPAAMQEEAMQKRTEEQRARARGEREAYEKSRPTDLQDAIRVFGQAGLSKGLSGLGPAHTAALQQRRAEDMAMERRQNELLTESDVREQAGAKELFGARTKAMDAANKSYQDQLQSRTRALADITGIDQRRIDEAANRLSQVELEKLRIAARAADAQRPGEAERIEAKYMSLKAQGKTKEAEDYLNNIMKIKGGTGAERQELSELKTLLKTAEDTAGNPLFPKATREAAAKRMEEINQQIMGMTKMGATPPSAAQTGKVPPPPPGFKLAQ